MYRPNLCLFTFFSSNLYGKGHTVVELIVQDLKIKKLELSLQMLSSYLITQLFFRDICCFFLLPRELKNLLNNTSLFTSIEKFVLFQVDN